MINSYGKNGKPFIINLLMIAAQVRGRNVRLTFPYIVGAYSYLDNNKLPIFKYVKIAFNDMIQITSPILTFESCDDLQTETIGLKSAIDEDFIKASRFLHIAPNSSMLYNAEIFGDTLTAESLYNRYIGVLNENKFSRNKETMEWEKFKPQDTEIIIKSYNL